MASLADARRIGNTLSGTIEEAARQFMLAVVVKGKRKGYAWSWLERIDPKKPRVPNPSVLAIRVANLGAKELIIASNAKKFFTEPHYDGYAAILVRLGEVRVAELRQLLTDGYRCVALNEATPRKRVALRSRR